MTESERWLERGIVALTNDRRVCCTLFSSSKTRIDGLSGKFAQFCVFIVRMRLR